MQQKMSTARSHVQSRINEITNLIAPPLDKHEDKDRATKPDSTEAAPSYQDAMCEKVSTDPPAYTEDDPESIALTAWKYAQGWI